MRVVVLQRIFPREWMSPDMFLTWVIITAFPFHVDFPFLHDVIVLWNSAATARCLQWFYSTFLHYRPPFVTEIKAILSFTYHHEGGCFHCAYDAGLRKRLVEFHVGENCYARAQSVHTWANQQPTLKPVHSSKSQPRNWPLCSRNGVYNTFRLAVAVIDALSRRP